VNIRAVLAIASILVVLSVACESDGDEPTPTATATEAAASLSVTATPTPSPTRTATSTVEPTSTAEPTVGGPVIATIRADEVQVWADVVFEGEPLRTLTAGDAVEVDQRRWHWVHLADGGWMPTDVTSVEFSASFDSLPEVVSPSHPAGTQTGRPAIDTIIDLALAADGASLMERAAFRDVECVASGDTGDFPCPSGTEAGTVFSVFSVVGCHGNPYVREDAEQVIEGWAGDELALYAVYDQTAGTAIVLTRNGAAVTLSLNGDGLLRHVDFGCGLVPPELQVRGVTEFILAPPEG
jgi:hypothetical protein